MSYLSALIASFNREEEGRGLAEYALILALIAIVAIVALLFLGGQISSILSTIGASVQTPVRSSDASIGRVADGRLNPFRIDAQNRHSSWR
jgi:pilus assembly protein Flp/PilA